MPQLTLNIRTANSSAQIFSAKDLREKFLVGIPLEKLEQIPEDTYNFHIRAAQQQIENYVNLKLNKEIIAENKDYSADDWQAWGYVRTTYPCVFAMELVGYLGTTKQVSYPKGWISARKTSDGRLYSRNIYLVPTQNSTHSEAIIYSGIMPNGMFLGAHKSIPNYWNLKYVTGFDKVPDDILQAIGMLAAIPILGIVSDMMMGKSREYGGVGFGVSSKSISIDGLSQSVSSYANGQTGIFGARMKQYSDTLLHPEKGLLKQLQEYYGSIVWGVA